MKLEPTIELSPEQEVRNDFIFSIHSVIDGLEKSKLVSLGDTGKVPVPKTNPEETVVALRNFFDLSAKASEKEQLIDILIDAHKEALDFVASVQDTGKNHMDVFEKYLMEAVSYPSEYKPFRDFGRLQKAISRKSGNSYGYRQYDECRRWGVFFEALSSVQDNPPYEAVYKMLSESADELSGEIFRDISMGQSRNP